MRKTIYCKDASIWESVKRKAGERGLSVSQFLLGLNMRDEGPAPGQLDRIEGKLDKLLSGQVSYSEDGSQDRKERVHKAIGIIDEARDEARILAEGQAKLDAKRKGRNVKKEKIAKVKPRMSSIGVPMSEMPFVNYSKDVQLGKKGGK